jgi:hypothetical protein
MVELLTPIGALVALAAVVPLAVMAVRRRRDERVRRALALAAPGGGRVAVGAVAALFALLGLAAAQPVVFVERTIETRRDAEAYVVLDASRSMLAAASPSAPTRFERAVTLALALRPALSDVPVGIASLTDRPLPHLFPSPDAAAFASVLERAVGVERPPPKEPGNARATSFASLVALAKANFFSAGSTRRLVLLLTDGETRPFDADELQRELDREGIRLVVVRLWDEGERVFAAGGEPEPYRPDPSDGALAALAAIGARIVAEGDSGAIAAAAREVLGRGPAVTAARERRPVALAPYLALGACLPLAGLLLRRGGDRGRARVASEARRARPSVAAGRAYREELGR